MRNFLMITGAVFVGGFAALIVWTLIVKGQVQDQVTAAGNNPALALLAKL